MAHQSRRSEEYELVPRTSSDSTHSPNTVLGYDASPPKTTDTIVGNKDQDFFAIKEATKHMIACYALFLPLLYA
jgi:hypothetical protein